MNFNLVGKRLNEARKDKNLTLEQVGNILGVDKSTVMRWEKGETKNIALPIIEKLSTIYNVNLDWLLGRSTEKNKNTKNKEKHLTIEYPENFYSFDEQEQERINTGTEQMFKFLITEIEQEKKNKLNKKKEGKNE